jgi:membrane protein implicated in regulation of membrane protease activity
MYRFKMIARKFWCLAGFVAIIFSIFALRAIYICAISLLHGVIPWWGLLSAALMTIFAYWWLSRILSKPGGCSRGSTNYHGSRDLDL